VEVPLDIDGDPRVTPYDIGAWHFGQSSPKVVATPTITPNGGSFIGSTTVTLATATAGATIHYTTDGSVPGPLSPAYTAPLLVRSSETISAMASASGMTNSAVAKATFQITVATPTITPNGGSFIGSTTVTLAAATAGAAIHYTTDGSVPGPLSAVYTAPLLV